MKQDNINYFSVGLFVIGTVLVLLIGLYNITGRGADADEYYVELKNVAGIRAGSPVTYAGFQIGQLLDIEPVRSNGSTVYRLKLQVRSGWQIPDDSVAQLVTPSLLGEKQIDIAEGKSKSYFAVGGTLQGKESSDVFELAQNISKEFQKLSEEGLQPLLKTLNKDIAGTIPQVMKEITSLVASLNKSSVEIQKIIESVDNKRIDKIVSNAEQVSESLLVASDKLDKLMATTSTMMDGNNQDLRKALLDLRTTMGVIEQNMNSIMYNIDATSRNLNEFSRQLRDNPSVIINSSAPKDSVRP